MEIVLLLIAAAAIIIAAAVYFRKSDTSSSTMGAGDNEAWPFFLRRPLSRPEQVLYFRLRNALPEHIVLAQVQLSRFLGVKRGHNFYAWNNRIDRLSADFLICSKDSSVVVAIELDDKSHEFEPRQRIDAKTEKALTSAGVRLSRWRTVSLPDEAAIRQEVLGQ
jgi:hypothetical protein